MGTRRHRPAAGAAVLAGLLAVLGLVGCTGPGAPRAASSPAAAATAAAAARTGDGTRFGFAVMPDTQNEASPTDPRTDDRVAWLLAHRDQLDLRWVLHSGDVENWDTPTHDQYATMSRRLARLPAAGLPLVAVPGNHDTAAVCPGGAACPGADTTVTVRDTTVWNRYYPPTFSGYQGLFEPGRSDNGWRTFDAGGLHWLVLGLELWPRAEVLDWAEQVVVDHPHDNVIVLTHSFLDGDGGINQTNGGYGATSPQQLWDRLRGHPNVVMVVCGHTGQALAETFAADDGHPVLVLLQALHAPATNPVRVVQVDTATGSVTTELRISVDLSRPEGEQQVDEVLPGYSATVNGLRFVR